MLTLVVAIATIISLSIAGYLLTMRLNQRLFIKKRLAAITPTKKARFFLYNYTIINSLGLKFEELIVFTGSRFSPEWYMTVSLIAAIIGSIIGTNILNNKTTGIVLGLWFAFVPFIVLQTMADNKDGKIDKILIHFFHAFLNRFSELRDYRAALSAIDENDYPVIEREITRLKDKLNAGDSLEAALNDFAKALRNKWARYFADVVIMAHETGSIATGPVSTLIGQLQRDEKLRHKTWSTLLFYKITFIGVSIAALGSYVWMSKNIPRTFYYFTNTELGKNLTFISSILLVICFLIIMLQRR